MEPDLNTTILEAIQGMMEMRMKDRQERRVQQQRQQALQEDEGIVEDEGIIVQERQVEGRGRGRNNNANVIQPRRMERDGGVKLKSHSFVERRF